MTVIAGEFDRYINELLRVRHKAEAKTSNDVTTRLLRDRECGRALRNEEIVSILRNWAVGERISLIWSSANRDCRVFEDPQAFRLDRDPAANLLYGAAIHACPGAPLARMEMRAVMEELLGSTNRFKLMPHKPPARAGYPASAYATLPLRIE